MFFTVLAAVYGLVLGSFFNVLICRLPEKMSVVWPASRCPKCAATLLPWHNIPVFSYLFLRGRCHFCKQPISPVYPLIELLTAAAAVILWFHFDPLTTQRPLFGIVVIVVQSIALLLIIPITVIDLRHYIIPDIFTIPLLIIAFGISFLPGALTPLSSLAGILAGGGLLFAIGWGGTMLLKKEAMGGGDIKLMAAAGALWGAQTALLSIVFGALLGSVYGISLMAAKKLGSDHQIPFGPFLGAGIWIAVLFGEQLLDAYMMFVGTVLGG